MKNTDFQNGISSYTYKFAKIPVPFPNGIERCAYCWEFHKSTRVDGLETHWCSLSHKLGMHENWIPDPLEVPDWCPLVDDMEV